MKVPPRILFWMPVYNQVLELSTFLDELHKAPLPCDEFLIIDNASSDGSDKLIEQSGFNFLRLPKNRGIGYSYQVVVKWALERNFDYLGTIAGNGKMLPQEALRLVEPILKGTADYVTGSRFMRGGAYPNLPLFRRITIPLVNLWVFFLSAKYLTDSTCGYRVFPLEMFRRAQFDWQASWLETYSFEYYIYAKVLYSKQFRTIEVPVTMRYPPRGQRYSKISGIVDWAAMLKPWVVAWRGGFFAKDNQMKISQGNSLENSKMDASPLEEV